MPNMSNWDKGKKDPPHMVARKAIDARACTRRTMEINRVISAMGAYSSWAFSEILAKLPERDLLPYTDYEELRPEWYSAARYDTHGPPSLDPAIVAAGAEKINAALGKLRPESNNHGAAVHGVTVLPATLRPGYTSVENSTVEDESTSEQEITFTHDCLHWMMMFACRYVDSTTSTLKSPEDPTKDPFLRAAFSWEKELSTRNWAMIKEARDQHIDGKDGELQTTADVLGYAKKHPGDIASREPLLHHDSGFLYHANSGPKARLNDAWAEPPFQRSGKSKASEGNAPEENPLERDAQSEDYDNNDDEESNSDKHKGKKPSRKNKEDRWNAMDGVFANARVLYGHPTVQTMKEITDILPEEYREIETGPAKTQAGQIDHFHYIFRAVRGARASIGGPDYWKTETTEEQRSEYFRETFRKYPLTISEFTWHQPTKYTDFLGIWCYKPVTPNAKVFRDLLEDRFVELCETFAIATMFGEVEPEWQLLVQWISFMGPRYRHSMAYKHEVGSKIFLEDVPMISQERSMQKKKNFSPPLLVLNQTTSESRGKAMQGFGDPR